MAPDIRCQGVAGANSPRIPAVDPRGTCRAVRCAIMQRDAVIASLSPHQVVRFIDWLESQAARHYEQRRQVKEKGLLDVAYGLKLEAHTYERVLHAFWQVIDGEKPERLPTRL